MAAFQLNTFGVPVFFQLLDSFVLLFSLFLLLLFLHCSIFLSWADLFICSVVLENVKQQNIHNVVLNATCSLTRVSAVHKAKGAGVKTEGEKRDTCTSQTVVSRCKVINGTLLARIHLIAELPAEKTM